MPVAVPSLIERIDAVLPQTQCRQCGFAGCLPYAVAIVGGHAGIDQCPPGGDHGVVKIAAVVGRSAVPQNPRYGLQRPFVVASIDEAACIGCTLCIQACPVDAIVGGAKRMHDVVAELCSGCELCVPACPVDCIRMVEPGFSWDESHAADARQRHRARASRLARLAAEASSKARPGAGVAAPAPPTAPSRKQAIVAAAVERARLLREQRADRAAVDDGR